MIRNKKRWFKAGIFKLDFVGWLIGCFIYVFLPDNWSIMRSVTSDLASDSFCSSSFIMRSTDGFLIPYSFNLISFSTIIFCSFCFYFDIGKNLSFKIYHIVFIPRLSMFSLFFCFSSIFAKYCFSSSLLYCSMSLGSVTVLKELTNMDSACWKV